MSQAAVAILIVNGGADPAAGRWLEMCLSRVTAHTRRPNTHIYVWNNNVDDAWVPAAVAAVPNATLVQADSAEKLAHPHAVPLQRLYERARADADVIVTLDSDAFPLRDGWLDELVDAVTHHSLAGVWRDELSAVIPPYVHASCLAVAVDFVERHGLRFDFFDIDPASQRKFDTLASFTARAEAAGITPYKLTRSNRRAIHRLMGGVYGDLVYHHGAGSRVGVGFWDEARTAERKRVNKRIRDLAAHLLFHHTDAYLAWLRGTNGPQPPARVFVLGMHRSGTSCLAGSLERCGVHLGDVSRANRFNVKGNHELADVIQLNDAILAQNGGRWDAPPDGEVVVSAESHTAIAAVLADFPPDQPAGLKDPRILLTADAWLEAADDAALIGTFRHPAAVARSLARRSDMPPARAHALWQRYNDALIARHRQQPFPLLAFDLRDLDGYKQQILEIAFDWGLQPDPAALNLFVTAALDSGADHDAPVPDACADAWAYLQGHAFRPRRVLVTDPATASPDALIITIWMLQATFADQPDAATEAAAAAALSAEPLRRPGAPASRTPAAQARPPWLRRVARRIKRLLRPPADR